MAAIDVYLQQILDAVYGEEVRGSIHDSIAAMNKESTNAEAAAISAQNSAKNSADTALIYMNNAESAADRAEAAAAEAKEHMKGGLRYKGSIVFANLPTSDMSVGDMYNIEDTFTADNRFRPEDRGKEFSPGTNVAWADNSMWDVVGSSIAGALLKDGSVVAEKLSIGTNSEASAAHSFANGYNAKAVGTGAHAEGSNTQANGNYSHAEGLQTIAGYAYQHVAGKYNQNKADTLFEVGNGTGANARGNALEVFSDGHINVNGPIYQNGSVLTFDDFKGASSTANGKHGMVPAPSIGDEDKYLKGDGSWAELDIPDPIPTGGFAGQVLTKNTDADKDASWAGGIYYFVNEASADAAVAAGVLKEGAMIITPGGVGVIDTGGGGSIVVDSALSTISTNPVQNNVITNELNKKASSTDLSAKQDKLIAGDNITIGPDGKTISATGGGGSAEYPTGGLTGQALVKKSDSDNDVEWGSGSYTFDTVAQMNAAIANGSIPNGSVIYVSEMSGQPAENLTDLTDVEISQVKDGEVLKWDAASESWVNGKAAAEIIVDNALSTTSENPVQNKVIATELDKKQNNLTFDSTPTANSTNPVTSGGIKTYAPFSFGVDSSGNYGYIKAGADTVTPFRNPKGTATTDQVLSGYTFANASSDEVSGSIVSQSTAARSVSRNASITLPAGYYASSHTVSGPSETVRTATSETISAAKTYYAGYYGSNWTVTPSGHEVKYDLFSIKFTSPTPTTQVSINVGFTPKLFIVFSSFANDNAGFSNVILIGSHAYTKPDTFLSGDIDVYSALNIAHPQESTSSNYKGIVTAQGAIGTPSYKNSSGYYATSYIVSVGSTMVCVLHRNGYVFDTNLTFSYIAIK